MTKIINHVVVDMFLKHLLLIDNMNEILCSFFGQKSDIDRYEFRNIYNTVITRNGSKANSKCL
jgi:hypothetical protein